MKVFLQLHHSVMRNRWMALCWLVAVISSASAQDALYQQKAARLYATATELMQKDQYSAALANFNEYLGLTASATPQRLDAEYYRSLCALKLYHGDAEKHVQDFIDKYPRSPQALTAYADLGSFFYGEKNYKKAANYFAKADFSALSAAQQNVIHFKWGYSLFSQRQLKEALDQFNFIKVQGGQYGPASSYYAGFVEYSLGDYASAIVDLKRAEQTESYATIVPYLLAQVYYKQGEYNTLIEYAKSVSGRQDLANAEEIALLSAEALFKKGEYKSALEGYDKYLTGREEKSPVNLLYRAGYSAYASGQQNKAINYFKYSYSDRDSVGYYAAYYLGLLYLKTDQKQPALTSFDLARRCKTDATLAEESAFQFAKVSYDVGRPDQAIAEFERILRTYRESSHTTEIKELLSQAYVNANNYNKAIEYIESLPSRSAAVDRAYQKATMLKAMDLFNQDDYTQAIQFFEKSMAQPVDKDYLNEASFWCAEAYSVQKKYETAAPLYHRVIDGTEDPTLRLKARYGLGYAYFNQQQYDRALVSFKEFVNRTTAAQPNYADGVLRLADCYYVSKNYNDALTFYRKALTVKSADQDYAHFQSGIILGILPKYTEAKTELSRVIRDYPESRFVDEAMFQLGQQEFEQGHYAEAVAGYSQLITTHPTSRFVPFAYVRRAAANFNLKEYGKTADDYVLVLQKYPTHPASKDVLVPLQEALSLAGRTTEFNQYLAAYKKSNPDAQGIEAVEFEAAKNLYDNQDYTNAIKNLESYLSAYPQSSHVPEAKYYLAECFYRNKDFTRAQPVYAELVALPSFMWASRVASRAAEIESKQGHSESAINYYRTLAKIATNKKDQYTAWNGLMESFFALAQYDSVERYANQILGSGSITAGAQNKATLFLGKAAMGKKDWETAKDELISTFNNAHDEFGAEAKYRLAEIFFTTKDYKQCNETLFSLNADFGEYTRWIGKSYLLLADSYVQLDNTYQAKATLLSLIENFPDADVKTAATEKLKKIEADEALRRQPKTDTTTNEKKQ